MSTEENKAIPDVGKSMPDVKLTDQQAENLRTAYRELCTSYRAIDDFRAKLLGFLPLATGTGIFLLLDKLKGVNNLEDVINNLTAGMQSLLVAVGVFGCFITLGLFFYEIYGILKCHALINAGKHMECLLDIHEGQFRKRPRSVLYFINEPFAAGVIYPAVLAAWWFLASIFVRPKGDLLAATEVALAVAKCVFIVGFAFTLIYNLVLAYGRSIYDFLLGKKADTSGEGT